ncbi:MAG: SpoVG family protein [Planctomycetes bacterium]|nr:SpoVG family protein [Planctomycetota bacterium]
MEVTEVRVKLASNRGDKLQAFASVTLDGAFVVRDIKVIKGNDGFFVAMPSRKLTVRCADCGTKNHLRAVYCNQCGTRLKERKAPIDERGRAKLHADIAHPINAECRNMIQSAIVEEFLAEVERSKQPGYKPSEEEDAGPD